MILLVARDAGGAEILSSWALRQKGKLRFALEEPARSIFARKLNRVLPLPVGENPDLIVCGTGTRGFERDHVTRAILRSVRCVVWVDHWKNYAARFHEMPNEVWVTDRYARDIFLREFPTAYGTRVTIKGNPYLEDVLADVRKLRRGDDDLEHVLFVHEPNRRREFLNWVKRSYRSGQLLRERPHPSVALPERPLAEDLAWADVVVGFDSMALVVALRARKRVVSLLPASESSIPFPGIEHA